MDSKLIKNAKLALRRGRLREALGTIDGLAKGLDGYTRNCPGCGGRTAVVIKNNAEWARCAKCGAQWGNGSGEKLDKIGPDSSGGPQMAVKPITKQEITDYLSGRVAQNDPDVTSADVTDWVASGRLRKSVYEKLHAEIGLLPPRSTEEDLIKGPKKEWNDYVRDISQGHENDMVVMRHPERHDMALVVSHRNQHFTGKKLKNHPRTAAAYSKAHVDRVFVPKREGGPAGMSHYEVLPEGKRVPEHYGLFGEAQWMHHEDAKRLTGMDLPHETRIYHLELPPSLHDRVKKTEEDLAKKEKITLPKQGQKAFVAGGGGGDGGEGGNRTARHQFVPYDRSKHPVPKIGEHAVFQTPHGERTGKVVGHAFDGSLGGYEIEHAGGRSAVRSAFVRQMTKSEALEKSTPAAQRFVIGRLMGKLKLRAHGTGDPDGYGEGGHDRFGIGRDQKEAAHYLMTPTGSTPREYQKKLGFVTTKPEDRGMPVSESRHHESIAFMSDEINHLVHDKDYPHKRAVAAALNVARNKGYKVGSQIKKTEDMSAEDHMRLYHESRRSPGYSESERNPEFHWARHNLDRAMALRYQEQRKSTLAGPYLAKADEAIRRIEQLSKHSAGKTDWTDIQTQFEKPVVGEPMNKSDGPVLATAPMKPKHSIRRAVKIDPSNPPKAVLQNRLKMNDILGGTPVEVMSVFPHRSGRQGAYSATVRHADGRTEHVDDSSNLYTDEPLGEPIKKNENRIKLPEHRGHRIERSGGGDRTTYLVKGVHANTEMTLEGPFSAAHLDRVHGFIDKSIANVAAGIQKSSYYNKPVTVDSDDDAMTEPPECPTCSGPGNLLGQLGRRVHFRCRNCGMGFSHDTEPTTKKPESIKKTGDELSRDEIVDILIDLVKSGEERQYVNNNTVTRFANCNEIDPFVLGLVYRKAGIFGRANDLLNKQRPHEVMPEIEPLRKSEPITTVRKSLSVSGQLPGTGWQEPLRRKSVTDQNRDILKSTYRPYKQVGGHYRFKDRADIEHHLDTQNMAFVSAADNSLPEAENNKRHQDYLRRLRQDGIAHTEATGVWHENGKRYEEPTVILHDVSPKQAKQYADHYNQWGHLHTQSGQVSSVQNRPFHKELPVRRGYRLNDKDARGWTEVKDRSGQVHRITLNHSFDQLEQ